MSEKKKTRPEKEGQIVEEWTVLWWHLYKAAF